MRRLDRLSYLTAGKPVKVQLVGRAGLVAVSLFVTLVLVLVVCDVRVSSSSSTSSSLSSSTKFASTSPPNSYKADTGDLLGVSPESSIKIVNSGRFEALVQAAVASPRGRKMVDLTQSPATNSMQVLLNTWTSGSYSPVHRHPDYSEAFVVLSGALAFFTFDDAGKATCTVLRSDTTSSSASALDRAIIIEKNTWHAMTAFPSTSPTLSTPHAIIFEISGHSYDPNKQTKELAPWAPSQNGGLDGDKAFFEGIMGLCR